MEENINKEKKKKLAKYSLKQIEEIFLSNGCHLLSTEYSNNKDILEYTCKCGKNKKITFKKYLVDLCCDECHEKSLTRKFKYKYQDVYKYFQDNNCELLSKEYLNNKSNLEYICECKNKAIICFKAFLNGQRCSKCAIEKRKITNLELYDNECSVNSEKIKEKWIDKIKNRTDNDKKDIKDKRKKTNLEKYGKEYGLQVSEIRDKGKLTSLEKYGKEFTLQVSSIRDKGKATMIEKYGVTNPAFSQELSNKKKVTNLERYGVEHSSQNSEIKEKIKATNLERYGVEYTTQNVEVRNKVKATNLERYGFEYVCQNVEVRNKVKATNLERYGFEYACQNPEIHEKIFKQRVKKYTLPSGKEINIQGYENYALDILLNKYTEDEILNSKSDMPVIRYKYKNINRRYFPDIYIPKYNKIIEVKSLWTYKRDLMKNIFKALNTRKMGYEYEIWIIDKTKIIYEI